MGPRFISRFCWSVLDVARVKSAVTAPAYDPVIVMRGNGMDRTQIEADIANIHRIAAVPRILAAVVECTRMRFAAVARVTETSWTACAVRDDLGFGLVAGDDLPLETTICNEIRQHHQPVRFNHASAHPLFRNHHTPLRYGLESYISVPIFRGKGEFFGTLCAIDSEPAEVEGPAVLRSLQLYSELIGLQLEFAEQLICAQDDLRAAESREQVVSTTEREVRDLFQPIVTGIYLLKTSPSLRDDDRTVVMQMEECCGHISRLLHRRLGKAYGRISGQPLVLQS